MAGESIFGYKKTAIGIYPVVIYDTSALYLNPPNIIESWPLSKTETWKISAGLITINDLVQRYPCTIRGAGHRKTQLGDNLKPALPS